MRVEYRRKAHLAAGQVPCGGRHGLVEMTGPAVPENGLQSFGDRVLAALEQHADGAAEAARLMIAALRERDWEGDDVLADQFDALLISGCGCTARLRGTAPGHGAVHRDGA